MTKKTEFWHDIARKIETGGAVNLSSRAEARLALFEALDRYLSCAMATTYPLAEIEAIEALVDLVDVPAA